MAEEENMIIVEEMARTAAVMTTSASARTLPETVSMTNRSSKPMTLTRVATSKQ